MPKPNIKLYVVMIVILFILFVIAVVMPSFLNKQRPITNQTTFPTPTLIQLIPTKQTNTVLISPTTTGGREDIPKNIEDAATQKQDLRRKTPLRENGFTITFDYAGDQFIVTLQQSASTSQELFKNWLKQNYPLIPMSKFNFK